MEKLQSVKVRALDTKATLESLNLKGKIHNVQTDFSLGWRSIAYKARKEAKTLNKKARKALATYEEGCSVRYDQIYDCDFDTGFEIWKKFQHQWIDIRQDTEKNAKKAELADAEICELVKDWRKWEATVEALHNNLISMPDIIAQVEIAQSQINAIGDQIIKIDQLMLDFEDICEQLELEKKKFIEKSELSQLVEKRQLQFQATKEKSEMTDEECEQMARVVERQESIEKHQIYEDAFLEQMNRYIKYGELDKPIAGSVDHDKEVEEVSFDEADLNALKEFLEPEELHNVLKSQATLVSCVDSADKIVEAEQTNLEKETQATLLKDPILANEGTTGVEVQRKDSDETTQKSMVRKLTKNTEINAETKIEDKNEQEDTEIIAEKIAEDKSEQEDTEWYDAEDDG